MRVPSDKSDIDIERPHKDLFSKLENELYYIVCEFKFEGLA